MMNEDRLELLLSFLKDDPQDEFTRFALAMEYRKLGKGDEAVKVLAALLEESPDYVGTYYHLGGLYREAGDQDRARSVLKKGIQIAEKLRDHHAKSELQSALMELDGEDLFD